MKPLRGKYSPPPDKSITHRALFFSALASGRSIIKNPLATGDCLSTLAAFKKMGVSIKRDRNSWTIISTGKFCTGGFKTRPHLTINCQNSGTTMRLLLGLLASQNFDATLTGDASLSKRPMKRVIEPLRKMGASITAQADNFAPLKINGMGGSCKGGFETRPYAIRPFLKGIDWRLPVASAQLKSAILLAGMNARGITTVTEPVKSRDHTERMLKGLGAKIRFNPSSPLNAPNRVSIERGSPLKNFTLTVPGDFSSASFFIAAALIVPGSNILIKNVNLNPTRTGLLKVLKRMDADIKIVRNEKNGFEPAGDVQVKYSKMKATSVHKEEIPWMIDEVPILAVIATQAEGTTLIHGAEELRVKESDRLRALSTELGRIGADIREKQDGLIIRGPSILRSATCESYHDHRIAMSLAIANLVSRGNIKIKNFSCTKVSYPNFLGDLKKLSND